ncbi:MAG TPA: hypothetical protein VEC37_16180 [Bacillota bacterium]|nr:hypothetical protein [Bacillota bacterium]
MRSGRSWGFIWKVVEFLIVEAGQEQPGELGESLRGFAQNAQAKFGLLRKAFKKKTGF